MHMPSAALKAIVVRMLLEYPYPSSSNLLRSTGRKHKSWTYEQCTHHNPEQSQTNP